jgi:hydroxymethylbilane synthase
VTNGRPPRAVTLGTRGSALARAQTDRVAELLGIVRPGIECAVRTIVTGGDRTQAAGDPLPEIGGKGLFTAELEDALRSGAIDIAVHSLKDLPTEEAPGLAIGAMTLRDDARDCLVARDRLTFDLLPPGATIGTSSLRRSAQLRGMRHDVETRSIRGNVDTRIRKVREGEFDAIVVAAAGIQRLEREAEVTDWFEPERMVPAPGQGTLALQCRADDDELLALLAEVDDPGPRLEGTAERTFLRTLAAGCTAPVAAHAVATSTEEVRMVGLVASVDGRDVVRVEGEGEPVETGERLAREALAAGAHEILEAIRV